MLSTAENNNCRDAEQRREMLRNAETATAVVQIEIENEKQKSNEATA